MEKPPNEDPQYLPEFKDAMKLLEKDTIRLLFINSRTFFSSRTGFQALHNAAVSSTHHLGYLTSEALRLQTILTNNQGIIGEYRALQGIASLIDQILHTEEVSSADADLIDKLYQAKNDHLSLLKTIKNQSYDSKKERHVKKLWSDTTP